MTWQILEGKNEIPITLFEAVADTVDAGKIYIRDTIYLDGNELVDEWRDKQAKKTFQLCLRFIDNYNYYIKNYEEQKGKESYYIKRKPEDSMLSSDYTIHQQFNLLRVVDNDKYPAYFIKDDIKYYLKIYKDLNDK